MSRFRFPRLSFTVICIICIAIIFLSRCAGKSDKKKASEELINPKDSVHAPASFNLFAGSEVCKTCHKDIYETHIKTAHYRSSQPASSQTVLGSFMPGHNRYTYDPSLFIAMEKRDSGLFQSVYFKGERKKDLKFDIVTGSGAKGQTYLYWQHRKLFQLPISYFTAPATWSVSPGFRKDKVVLDKPITSRCLECHATYAGLVSAPDIRNEEYDNKQIIFGIDCERCHGPAAEHVAFHQQQPNQSIGKHIIQPSSFTRQQKLDLCVLCHGGNIQKTQPSFSFKAGDRLSDYFKMDTAGSAPVNSDNIDVHGNQFALLKASKCFLKSEMTCMTCHDSHLNERGKLVVFSKRCISCHSMDHEKTCTVNPRPTTIEQNCIDCHMPKRPSISVTLYLEGQETPAAAMVRSHFISIYPEETKKLRSVIH